MCYDIDLTLAPMTLTMTIDIDYDIDIDLNWPQPDDRLTLPRELRTTHPTESHFPASGQWLAVREDNAQTASSADTPPCM